MAKISYSPAPEVKKIAEELIPKYHQHLIDFDVRLEYIFINKIPKSKGKEVWISCKKISSLNAFLANAQDGDDPFFVITVSKPIWDILSNKEALVDHGLCYAWAEANQKEDEDDSEPVKLSVLSADLEEFTCIARRHGVWRDGVKEFDSALKRD